PASVSHAAHVRGRPLLSDQRIAAVLAGGQPRQSDRLSDLGIPLELLRGFRCQRDGQRRDDRVLSRGVPCDRVVVLQDRLQDQEVAPRSSATFVHTSIRSGTTAISTATTPAAGRLVHSTSGPVTSAAKTVIAPPPLSLTPMPRPRCCVSTQSAISAVEATLSARQPSPTQNVPQCAR